MKVSCHEYATHGLIVDLSKGAHISQNLGNYLWRRRSCLFHTPARISRSGTSKQSGKFFFDLLQSLTPLLVDICVERAMRVVSASYCKLD